MWMAMTTSEAAVAVSVVVMVGLLASVIAWQLLAIARNRSGRR